MEIGTKNWIIIAILAIVIAIVVSVIALVIYDTTMTPHDQQVSIDKINSYLSRLIIGYEA